MIESFVGGKLDDLKVFQILLRRSNPIHSQSVLLYCAAQTGCHLLCVSFLSIFFTGMDQAAKKGGEAEVYGTRNLNEHVILLNKPNFYYRSDRFL